MRATFKVTAAVALTALVAGCGSARVSDKEVDEAFRSGNYDKAEAKLREGIAKQGDKGRDLLIYLLDLGLTLHQAGKIEESIKVFRQADKIAEIKDYTSLATEASTLLVSDNIKDYKGEDFEKVLINTYLAIDYAVMGNMEDALVEARVVNRKLYLMVSEGQKKYQQNAFARYLSATLYEAEGNWNDAYVDYKKTYELVPTYPGLGLDLYRLARLTGNSEAADDWVETFKLDKDARTEAMRVAPGKKNGGKAEIIVLYQNGISPEKKANPDFRTIPKFYARMNPVHAASIDVTEVVAAGAAPATPLHASTAVLHDIEKTAIANLDEKYLGLIAKKVAGVVAKEVVGKQVENLTKSPLAGLLTKVALYATDQADLRSWNLLPRDLQIARIAVDPGTYTVKVSPSGASALPEKTIQVAPGKKVYVSFRYMP